MPRELIASRRARATTLANRLEGLKKKARELSILCDVRVAVVCAGGEGAAPPDVWESEEGVLAASLPPASRAAHAHRAYADADLAKEEAKLARVRQAGPPALQRWDQALDGADAEEAARVLGDVDAALAAVEERRRALGLPDDDGGLLQGVAPPLRPCGGGSVVGYGYPLGAQGGGDASGGRYEQAMWGHGVHQYPGGGGAEMDGYGLQMATGMNGYGFEQRSAGPSHPSYASQFYGGVSDYVPSNGGPFQPYLHNLSVDLGLGYIDNAQGYGGGNFVNAPLTLPTAMGTADNFSNPAPARAVAMYTSCYATQWPAQQQVQSASSSQQSGIEQLHYLSDVEDTQLQLWGN